jgi:hypothetical protein
MDVVDGIVASNDPFSNPAAPGGALRATIFESHITLQ